MDATGDARNRRDLNRVWEFLKLSFRDVNLAGARISHGRTFRHSGSIGSTDGPSELYQPPGLVGTVPVQRAGLSTAKCCVRAPAPRGICPCARTVPGVENVSATRPWARVAVRKRGVWEAMPWR